MPHRRLLGLLLALALALPQAAGADAADDSISKPLKLLYRTPHLDNAVGPGVLHYDLRSSGPEAEDALDDVVRLQILRVNADGGKDALSSFPGAEKRKEFPEVAGFHGNPLVMHFLQWDVERMDDRTDINHHHLRNQILDTMRRADGITAEPAKIVHAGRTLPAWRVSFAPFGGLPDKMRRKLGAGVGKRYVYTLADDVPGGIYAIETVEPAAGGAERRTELKFKDATPPKSFRAAGAGAAR